MRNITYIALAINNIVLAGAIILLNTRIGENAAELALNSIRVSGIYRQIVRLLDSVGQLDYFFTLLVNFVQRNLGG